MKRLIIAHVLVGLFLSSWWICPSAWLAIDTFTFKTLNAHLISPSAKKFWAVCSLKYSEFLLDGVLFTLFTIYIIKGPKERLRRLSEVIVLVIAVATIIAGVNKHIIPNVLHVSRRSPTAVFEKTHRIKNVLETRVKDRSLSSFPADHGTTAMFLATFCFTFLGWRYGIFGTIYGAFYAAPRLVSGAHWLTDMLMGSAVIVLLAWSYLFGTPLFNTLTNQLLRFVCLISRRPYTSLKKPSS